ncbi:MAG: enoyl-CoA hydratase/isomerase family protein [Magnetococcales bacterium]|nr:enoyl-CoA hydratase/isomerase family protein [Magnetococcales bacterium]
MDNNKTDRKIGTGHHWQLEQDETGIAWLTLDVVGSGANVLSTEVLLELDRVLDPLVGAPPRGLVILSAKKSGFIAGADVTEFTDFQGEAQAREHIRKAGPIFNKLENLSCPTVAMIHGFCLGGGLELALSCRYRLAEEAPCTRLGLPEVKLGIHPGFGGTVRLNRLIGHLQGLGMMLTGRTLNAKAARKLGLVDRTAPRRHLKRAAVSLIEHPPLLQRAGFWQRVAGFPGVRALVASYLHRQVAVRAPVDHYPAPHALIDLWQRWAGDPQEMFSQEANSVARLFNGESARSLIRLFTLREQMKGVGKGSDFRPKRLHVIGAGVMGGDIAAWAALNGMVVTLHDQSQENISRALVRANKLYRKKLKDPYLVRDALDRLIPDTQGVGVGKADVVIEAIFENLIAKQSLFREVEKRLKPGALLATNTSSIPLEEIASVLEHPRRLVGLHFFNPVAKMPLLEVVTCRKEQTDPAAVAAACGFAVTVDRLPLVVKSGPGFLINRILLPYLLEAVTLVAEGVDPRAVDRAALRFGMPMGPIALADQVGLDISLSVAEILATHLGRPVPTLLRERVELGCRGKKSDCGFYRYKKGKAIATEFKGKRPPPEDLMDRLILPMINEAVACLREGVVADPDGLDGGIVFGTGFAPFRGGPMAWVATRGVDNLLKRLKVLEMRHGHRFKADAGWNDPKLLAWIGQREKNHEKTHTSTDPTLEGGYPVRLVSGAG